jgi:hypothetical protein
MAIFSDANGEAAGAVQETGASAPSSSSGDDVLDPVNLEEDDLWWKSELCSGCRC